MGIEIRFSDFGPFDVEERATIREVVAAVAHHDYAHAPALLAKVVENIQRLDLIGEALSRYPSIFDEQVLGHRQRGLDSLLDALVHTNLSNFAMFLPTRALIGRNLVLGEVNFYRLLRIVCADALPEPVGGELRARVDRLLCVCLYTRLAEEVLIHIASDAAVERRSRETSVLALAHIWQRAAYRIDDFFPVLQATWEARRRVPVTLGAMLGASEMFRLLQAGCDERFVDYLVSDGSEEHSDALREFLFGATTEQLARIEARRQEMHGAVSADDCADIKRAADPGALGGDPALAMFEFFLSRHLQAAARRSAKVHGPKRTAEEYVLLRYLQERRADEILSRPPKGIGS